MNKFLYLYLLTKFCLSAAENILILHPFYGGSHILTMRRLAEALTERDHKVKIIRWLDINSYPPIINSNITELALSVNNTEGSIPFVTHEGRGRFNLPVQRMWEQGLNLDLFPIEGFITVSAYCKELLSSDGLIHQLKKQNFKVAVVDLVFNECGLALAHKLGLPIVGFWGFNFASGPAFYSAAFNPPSALPQTFSSYGNSMTFMERVWNTLIFLGIYSLMQTQFIVTNNVIQQYVKDCPHPSQLISNASGMLINSHPAIDFPRLLPPSYLEVAGMHQRDIKPLPEDILDFINSSGDEGIILFSMGFNFDSKYVPRKVFEDYFRAFGRLKQKVIVKAKGLPSYLPSNVKIYSFFPQADILAHNKTVLFVSHCGMHGVMEAIRSEVPIVGIPVFLDQKDNLRRLEELGVARGLDKEADANEIEFVLKEVLRNSSYKENMKLLSRNVKAFGSPLKKAVWLLEHIIETKGAPHLKLGSRDLHLLQYLCIDIIAFFLLIIAIFLTAIFKIIVKVRRTFVEAEISTKVKLN
ncbi:UNVERIFIED_CONTAM: hypothetical protein RMT77_009569 [Armadillidium vulgare]